MLKNTVLNTVDRVLMAGSRILSAIVIARVLGPEGYGVFQVALTASVIAATLADFGFGIANNFLASQYPHMRAKLLGNAIIIVGSLGVISALGTLAVIYVFRINYFTELPDNYLLWIPISIPVQAIQISLVGLIYGTNKFKEKVIGTSLHYFLFLFSIMILACIDSLSADSLIPLWVLGLVISSIYWIAILLKNASSMPTYDKSILKEQMHYGRNAFFYNVANMINFRLDLFFIAYFLDADSVGWYALATSVTEALLYLPKALSNVMLTDIASNQGDDVKSRYYMMYRCIIFIIGMATIGIAIFAPFAIPMIFSQRFEPAVAPLILLLPGNFAMALGTIASYHLFGLGKSSLPSIATFVATVVTIVLDVMLIPIFGIQGAALASTLSYSIFCAVCMYFLFSITRIRPAELLVPRIKDIEMLIHKVWIELKCAKFVRWL